MAEEFTCGVDPWYRSACVDLPEYKDAGYCVLHFPGEDKREDFRKSLKSKLGQKDYDSGALGPAAFTILHMNFRERLFHEVR